MKDGTFFKSVYAAVRQIPKGKVATYGDIAFAIGRPRAAKVVGWALHVNPEPLVTPCHRVVNRFGKLAVSFGFGGAPEQQRLLELEDVEVVDGAVDLEKYRAVLNGLTYEPGNK
ncbi:DNA base-flipping protein [bioreactor metagenome]|uniref:DNA base-flipping protein n=1 Tax=bioreactor metagenome TaxID=1076179 RepID=A0A645DUT0_9ZZZZ